MNRAGRSPRGLSPHWSATARKAECSRKFREAESASRSKSRRGSWTRKDAVTVGGRLRRETEFRRADPSPPLVRIRRRDPGQPALRRFRQRRPGRGHRGETRPSVNSRRNTSVLLPGRRSGLISGLESVPKRPQAAFSLPAAPAERHASPLHRSDRCGSRVPLRHRHLPPMRPRFTSSTGWIMEAQPVGGTGPPVSVAAAAPRCRQRPDADPPSRVSSGRFRRFRDVRVPGWSPANEPPEGHQGKFIRCGAFRWADFVPPSVLGR